MEYHLKTTELDLHVHNILKVPRNQQEKRQINQQKKNMKSKFTEEEILMANKDI